MPTLLSADQERALSVRIQSGDLAARNALVQANLGLVVAIARHFWDRGLDSDELVSAGNLGLIEAAQRFQPVAFETRFSTYANYWIKEAIHTALLVEVPLVRVPAHLVVLLGKWRKVEDALRKAGRHPTFERVADVLGLSPLQRRLVRQARQATAGHGWVGAADRSVEQPADVAIEHEHWAVVGARLDRLPPRERTIIDLRYGLLGEPPYTLRAIGAKLRITREWVRVLEQRALRKLGGDTDLEAMRRA